MRIDSFQKVSSIYQANSTAKAIENSKKAKSDKCEISQLGKDYQLAKAALGNTPDVRMDKVNEIKARMEAGNYHLDSEELADKLIEDYYDEFI
jgi:negative regulator of flagellin synthesis FlgM